MDYRQYTSPPPHLYSQSIQLRLYQALIFSIPILFSIILFLLFYLFYLKKSSISASTPQQTLPVSSNQAPYTPSGEMVLKGNLKEKLEVVLFNEDMQTSYSTCCVCLGEFEVGEELHRIATCKHLFHVDCICYWLYSNPTCPLCRCLVDCTTKHSRDTQPLYGPPNPVMQVVDRNTLLAASPHQREQIYLIPAGMSYIL